MSGRYPEHYELQELEARRLLAVATAWVDDNWVISNDVGTVGLSSGDTVENTAAGEDGTVKNKTFGVNAFSFIGDAVKNTSAGGTVLVIGGTYKESDILLKSAVTIDGDLGNTNRNNVKV